MTQEDVWPAIIDHEKCKGGWIGWWSIIFNHFLDRSDSLSGSFYSFILLYLAMFAEACNHLSPQRLSSLLIALQLKGCNLHCVAVDLHHHEDHHPDGHENENKRSWRSQWYKTCYKESLGTLEIRASYSWPSLIVSCHVSRLTRKLSQRPSGDHELLSLSSSRDMTHQNVKFRKMHLMQIKEFWGIQQSVNGTMFNWSLVLNAKSSWCLAAVSHDDIFVSIACFHRFSELLACRDNSLDVQVISSSVQIDHVPCGHFDISSIGKSHDGLEDRIREIDQQFSSDLDRSVEKILLEVRRDTCQTQSVDRDTLTSLLSIDKDQIVRPVDFVGRRQDERVCHDGSWTVQVASSGMSNKKRALLFKLW